MWASNADSSVNENFQTDVTASFFGLTSSGNFDASIQTTDQYKTFQKSMQKTISCNGGNVTLANSIKTRPDAEGVFDTFNEWSHSAEKHPDVTSFKTEPLWTLMAFAKDNTVASYAKDVNDAFMYLVEHPQTHRTSCRIIINSDRGEIGLLTPSAFIEADPRNPLPSEAVLTSTKLSWASSSKIVTMEYVLQSCLHMSMSVLVHLTLETQLLHQELRGSSRH